MMRAGFTIGLLFFSTGCPVHTLGDDPDAASRGAGLVVVMHGDIDNPSSKDSPADEVSLTGLYRVELELEDVRAIGDAAPGDNRTTIAQVSLEWGADEVQCLGFDNVPPGIYSRVLARVVRYRIEGALEDASESLEFTVEDTPPTPLSLTVDTEDVVVDVGEDGVLALELSAAPLVDAVDWEDHIPDAEGRVRIDGASGDIDAVREAMREFLRPDGEPDDSSCPE